MIKPSFAQLRAVGRTPWALACTKMPRLRSPLLQLVDLPALHIALRRELGVLVDQQLQPAHRRPRHGVLRAWHLCHAP